MSDPAGFTALTLVCRHCGERFGFAASSGTADPTKLPNPFEVKCPHCETQSTYPKSSIEILAVSREGESR
jgi:hypothetical protein